MTGAGDLDDDDVLVDPYDARFARRASGLLADFNRAGVLSAADVHVARTLGRLGDEADERVLLAAALAVRAVRLGSVCIALAEIRDTIMLDDDSAAVAEPLAWPVLAQWRRACADSSLVADDETADTAPARGRPLRLEGDLLYLDRYWRQEEVVRTELEVRSARPSVALDMSALAAALARLFPGPAPDRQRLAAAMAVLRNVSIIAGGPGTGKTTTVARLMALLRSLPGKPPRIALAAPTGKAAARLQEAVTSEAAAWKLDLGGEVAASTVHRLLGWRPDSRSRFRHDRHNRLPYDVVIVDESSMVSLTLMSRLVEALRPDARLVLVGDPDQLASVEAGAVLGDLVARPAAAAERVPALLGRLVGGDVDPEEERTDEMRNGVVRLIRTHRFGVSIGNLAKAIKHDDLDGALDVLRSGDEAVSFVETPDEAVPSAEQLRPLRDDVISAARELAVAATEGNVLAALAGLERHRLLCAHRRGPYGVSRWTVEIATWLEAALGDYAAPGEWYLGRPLLITANDHEIDLFNGDTGVIVNNPAGGMPIAAFGRGGDPILVSPSRLSAVQTVHAMTVHRAQGSQFDTVTLLLPSARSPLLTRELVYTAVTRAKEHVRVIGSESAVRRAVGRPIVRASGLRRRAGSPFTPPS